MNRALPLLLLAMAVLGGGLAFLAFKSSPSDPGQSPGSTLIVGGDTGAAEAAEAPESQGTDTAAALAEVDVARASAGVPTEGTARTWEIIPVNTVGQRVDTAQLTATPSAALQSRAQTMKGNGRTRWTSLPAGAWTLTVEDASSPTWTREIILEADGTKRTTVYLGEELRVSGVIQDSNGTSLGSKTPVFFLPKGVSHPTRAQMKASGKDRQRPLARKGPSNGAIAVQTDRKGRFKTRLPKAGEYRVSVGAPDKPRWTQKKGIELTHGGADHVTVTVPALAELKVEFTGEPDERPSSLSAYVFDAERAARVAEQAAQRRSPASASSVQEAQRLAKEEALGEGGSKAGGNKPGGRRGGGVAKLGQAGTARSMRDENAKITEEDYAVGGFEAEPVQRTPLFEPGWRSIGSRQVGADGTALFNDLPDSEDVRFLFVRGKERISTQVPIRLRAQQRALGTVTLPPPSPEPGFFQSNLASLLVKDRPEEEGVERPETGVRWSVARR